ncbi:MAG: DUF1189 family protein [Anaeroplasmataceae bacterium]
MKEKMNFLTRVKISTVKVKNYSLLIKDGLGKAFVYMLILSILVGSVLGVIQFTVLNKIEKEAIKLLQQEDFKFEISNNILDFKKSPYKQEKGRSIVIIDSNKNLDDVESFKSVTVHKDISYVFLADGFVTRIDSSEFKLKYSEIPFIDGNINNELVIKTLNELKPVKYIMVLAMIFVTYIIAIVKALLISLAGLMSNSMTGANLKYEDILKLSIYALTLPMILEFIIPIGSYSIIVAGLYLIIAISSIKKEQNIKL